MLIKSNKISQQSAAVVTGAGSGIGKSFAYEISKRGGSVLCVDIDEEAATKTASMLKKMGGIAVPYQCDVGNADEMMHLSNEAEKLLGRPITLLINNAGVGVGGAIGKVPLEDWKWCVDVNLWGVIHGCHFFAPKLKSLGYGGIINVASAAAFGAAPEMSAYNVTKAGVLALSETLSAEFAGTGVHISALCPTLVPTNIITNGRIDSQKKSLGQRAMNSLAMTTSDKVAKLSLNMLDKGKLYILPQLDARVAWRAKRLAPRLYTKTIGEVYRLFA